MNFKINQQYKALIIVTNITKKTDICYKTIITYMTWKKEGGNLKLKIANVLLIELKQCIRNENQLVVFHSFSLSVATNHFYAKQ